MDALEVGVALALHDAVDAGDAHVVMLAVVDPGLDLVEGPVHVDGADADAEDVDAGDHPAAAASGVGHAASSEPCTRALIHS